MLLPSHKMTNDFDWMRTEIGNLRHKLDTLIARHHEAQDQGEFLNAIFYVTFTIKINLLKLSEV